jgi:hypothetical protein
MSSRASTYRSAGGVPRVVRDLAFDRLPPAIRDRLTRGLANGAPDALLAAFSGAAPLALRASLAAAVTAGVGLLGVAIFDLGTLGGKHALQGPAFAAVYGALFFTAVVAAGAWARIRSVQRGAPFRSGRYLFSLDLLEAEGGRLRVTSLDTLRRVEASHRQVTAVFEDGHSVTFPLAGHQDPAALADEANRAVTAARALVYPADEARLSRIDPFFELRLTEDWASAQDERSAGRSRLPWLVAAALLSAAPVGIGLREARNALSDELMFLEAKNPRPGDSVPGKLGLYVAQGRRHRAEAGRLFVEEAGDDRVLLRRYMGEGGPLADIAGDALFDLAKSDPEDLGRIIRRGGPRAAEADEALFAIARRIDTPAAYSTYLEHGRRHAAEVRQDLRPDAEFRQAVRSGLVGTLFSFVRRNPGSRHEDEAWGLARELYADAHTRLVAIEQPPPEGRRFAEALLAALQDRADPRVAVDVRMGDATSIAALDAAMSKRHGDRYQPAWGYFAKPPLDGLGLDVRAAVADWFGRAFPHGVAEVTGPTEDEGRPRFEIRCDPAAYGVRARRVPTTAGGDAELVMPQVGFDVEVRGAVTGRDGTEATLTWKLRLEDTADAAVLDLDVRGVQGFLDGVPARVAASFHDKL